MIYCVEDDHSIRDLMIYTLTIAGFEAHGFADSEQFWKAMQGPEQPELILLDIMLPGEDGISILRKLRFTSSTAAIPVIMATAKGSEYDRVIGLDLGADDYLCKPFGMMEMVARVRALLRRTEEPETSRTYRVGTVAVCPDRHTAAVDGREISLTYKEFSLLCLLLENAGTVLTRDVIMDRVWGSDFDGENRTVDVHIRTLRSKLGPEGRRIATVRGVGYKMEVES